MQARATGFRRLWRLARRAEEGGLEVSALGAEMAPPAAARPGAGLPLGRPGALGAPKPLVLGLGGRLPPLRGWRLLHNGALRGPKPAGGSSAGSTGQPAKGGGASGHTRPAFTSFSPRLPPRQDVRSAAASTLVARPPAQQPIPPGMLRSPGNLHVPQQAPGPSSWPQWQQQAKRTPQPPPPQQQQQQPQQPQAAATPAGGGQYAVVEGTVKTITLENKSSGYLVAKIKVSAGDVPPEKMQRKGIVTAVATGKQLLLGQRVRLQGAWTQHQKYGFQLQVDAVTVFQASEREAALGLLQGAGLPGVGPVTAARLAEHFGARLEGVMDAQDAARRLAAVKGVGAKSAVRIKQAWDGSRGRREAAAFLEGLGLRGPVVQRVVAKHGEATQRLLQADAYAALQQVKGVDLRTAEQVAGRLGADPQSPARAGIALREVLLEAASRRGHTYLPWAQLQQRALDLLNASGMPFRSRDLSGNARFLVSSGDIVVESGGEIASAAAEAGADAQSTVPRVEAALRAHLTARIPGVGPKRAQALVQRWGSGVIGVLDSADAAAQLAAVLPPHLAAEVKAHWDANPRRKPAWLSPVPGVEVPPGWSAAAEAAAQPAAGQPAAGPWAGGERCYAAEMHAAEVRVARELARLAARPPLPVPGARDPAAKIDAWISKNERGSGTRLSEGQRAAVKAAGTAPVLVLTGGPGCGKTLTTATIVKLWSAMKKEVRLAAPTGRASQRLQEMAGVPSCTIHRLLQYKAAGGGRGSAEEQEEQLLAGSFGYCKANPLPAGAVLVDEAAMLDVGLAAALLEALPTNCQLVLVGDVDQLPPVGPGAVLAAAIGSGAIPVIDLREIFRQSHKSGIVTAAHAVQQGAMPQLDLLPPAALQSKYTGEPLSDALWVRPEGPADGAALQGLVTKVLCNYVHPLGFNPATDVQVLVPMRRGTAGVESMNAQLQALLNPERPEAPEVARGAGARPGGPVFRLRDRVVQVVNNYEREVFNGDPGFITDVSPADRRVTVEFPETDFGRIHAGHTTKSVEYRASALWELDMAWATTVHKAQGGESPVVVLLLAGAHRPLLTRRLLYTALTRAQLLVVVVGPERALRTAVGVVDADARLSSLQLRLQAHADRLGVARTEVRVFEAPQPAAEAPAPAKAAVRAAERPASGASKATKSQLASQGAASAEAQPKAARAPPARRRQPRGTRASTQALLLAQTEAAKAPGKAAASQRGGQPAPAAAAAATLHAAAPAAAAAAADAAPVVAELVPAELVPAELVPAAAEPSYNLADWDAEALGREQCTLPWEASGLERQRQLAEQALLEAPLQQPLAPAERVQLQETAAAADSLQPSDGRRQAGRGPARQSPQVESLLQAINRQQRQMSVRARAQP